MLIGSVIFDFIFILLKPNKAFNTLKPRQNGHHFQTIFSNAFSLKKMYEFCLRFHWILFLLFKLIIFQHRLGSDQATSYYLSQWRLVYWCIYASLGIETEWRNRVTHICIGEQTIIGSDNGLLPDRHQAIIWTNAGILSTGPLGTNFSEILIEIYTFSFKKMHLKMPSGKWRPSCLGLNELTMSSSNGLSHVWHKDHKPEPMLT